MARIIVTTNTRGNHEHGILLDEDVCPEHMSDEHTASQLLERLGWAVTDAERAPAVVAGYRVRPPAPEGALPDRVPVPHTRISRRARSPRHAPRPGTSSASGRRPSPAFVHADGEEV
jgi:hypothetical protein